MFAQYFCFFFRIRMYINCRYFDQLLFVHICIHTYDLILFTVSLFTSYIYIFFFYLYFIDFFFLSRNKIRKNLQHMKIFTALGF